MLGLDQWTKKELQGNVPRKVEKSSNYLKRKKLPPNSVIFQRKSPLTDSRKRIRLKFIEYYWRSKDEIVSNVSLWEHKHGREQWTSIKVTS